VVGVGVVLQNGRVMTFVVDLPVAGEYPALHSRPGLHRRRRQGQDARGADAVLQRHVKRYDRSVAPDCDTAVHLVRDRATRSRRAARWSAIEPLHDAGWLSAAWTDAPGAP